MAFPLDDEADSPPAPAALRPRDLLVLLLSDRGYSTQQIAALTCSTVAEIEAVRDRSGALLGARDWRQAVLAARRRGLLPPA
jgi:DNA-binding NarL/FixJ family response regulator